ncbi:hypothetical protein A2Z22_02990 [Candidatus Woesebacteria bacterium RBG_16_34_12]|uniref:Uncharacterized protein n=1 Tax=Candidatus Woesebacteria bacterium RBG_16_34_12 TaxID=1802480 RepID=A0A1F7X6X7_9BACT|nr:MAG: hypothetical protein A2Z22_02990 [Candidatus Woesebacteria bacterium RBG_16_34_12]
MENRDYIEQDRRIEAVDWEVVNRWMQLKTLDTYWVLEEAFFGTGVVRTEGFNKELEELETTLKTKIGKQLDEIHPGILIGIKLNIIDQAVSQLKKERSTGGGEE